MSWAGEGVLKAGILAEDGGTRDTITGTPQGGILSPLLANIALSVLDDHFAEAWERASARARIQRRRRQGLATNRLVRYADDFVVMVAGTRAHAEALRDEVAAVLAPMGLRLSEEKTRVAHIDEGFDFLGWRIQRQKRGETSDTSTPTGEEGAGLHQGQGAGDHPAGNEPAARRPAAPAEPGAAGLDQLLPARRVPARPSATCDHFTWLTGHRMAAPQAPRAQLEASSGGATSPRWWPERGRMTLFDRRSGGRSLATATGAAIPTPWSNAATTGPLHQRHGSWRAGCGGSRTSGSEGGPEKPTGRKVAGRSGPTPTARHARGDAEQSISRARIPSRVPTT